MLSDVAEVWTILSNPQKDGKLLNANSWNPQITALLHRGRKFAELGFMLGLNIASKRARQHYMVQTGSYDGGKGEFFDALDSYNSFILHSAK